MVIIKSYQPKPQRGHWIHLVIAIVLALCAPLFGWIAYVDYHFNGYTMRTLYYVLIGLATLECARVIFNAWRGKR